MKVEVNVPLLCLGCGAEGAVVMKRGLPVDAQEPFYLRVCVHFTDTPQIVCGKCGMVHPLPRLRAAAHG
jgi:hypothetical protein